MNVYLKNLLFAILGIAVILACMFVPTIPELAAGYAIFIALLFVARGLGKIINEFFVNLYIKKRSSNVQNPPREQAVHSKSVSVTLIITLCILTVVAVKPQLFGSPSNDIILFLAVFLWHIINIPVFIHYDKNLVLKIKKL